MSVKLRRHLLSDPSHGAHSALGGKHLSHERVEVVQLTRAQRTAELGQHKLFDEVMVKKFATRIFLKGNCALCLNIARSLYVSNASKGKVDLSVYLNARTWFSYVMSLVLPVPFHKRTVCIATQ
jgi:hypothetical protein